MQAAPRDLFRFEPPRGEGCDDVSEQRVGAITVIGTEIADIDVERDASDFRPGMYRQVRFGQDDGAGDASRVARRIMESVEEATDDRQPVSRACRSAKCFELRGGEQEVGRAAAVKEVGDQVQAIHGAILLRFT